MRFVYLGAFRFPEGDAASARVINNARILRELGHEVEVWSFGGEQRDTDKTGNEYLYDGFKYIVTNDIDTRSLKERLTRYTFPGINCWRTLKTRVNSIDVIIVYNPTYSLNKRLIRFCRRYNLKLIADLTEWYGANEMPGGKYSPIYWMSERNMKHLQRKIPNKILISTYLLRYYNRGNNILLPPLVDLAESKWKRNVVITNQYIVNHRGIRIIYAGTPTRKDMLTNLIVASADFLGENNRLQLLFLGVTQEQGQMLVADSTLLRNHPKNFVFLGKIPQNHVPAYYKLADFSAIIREPTRKNMAGFPTKMAESMGAGCPVIMNSTSDLANFVKDGENAIVLKDYSIESISKGLKRILALDVSTLEQMRRNAKLIGETKFNYPVFIPVMKEFVDNLK